jgi:hypothetical protein
MQKVYKYHVFADNCEIGINVPVGAKPIWAEGPFVYYQFDEKNEYTMEMRRVISVYTGAKADTEHATYIGSTIDGARIVRHFYQL